MKWLDLKLKAVELVSNARKSLAAESDNTNFDECNWAKDHIFCIENSAITDFVKEKPIMPYCRPIVCSAN